MDWSTKTLTSLLILCFILVTGTMIFALNTYFSLRNKAGPPGPKGPKGARGPPGRPN